MDPILVTILTVIVAVLGTVWAIAFAIRSLKTEFTVAPYTVAIVFVKNQPGKIVGPGRYRLWTRNVQVVYVDPHDQWIHVAGQELLTSDGAPVRVSVSALRSVADVEKFAAAGDTYSALYAAVQLAVREQVLTHTMDELLQDRKAIDEAMKAAIQPDAEKMGIRIGRLAVRDFTLIGDTKRAYSEVVQAQLQAKAALERARGEGAAMRSLLNTAELVRKNPELLQLRALQQFGGGNQTQLHLTIGEPPTAPR